MKFICQNCKKIIELYKVKFTAGSSGLICKDAVCCNEYMRQVKTEEYNGMPTIHRNEPIHSTSYDSDKLWLDAKKKLASGEPPKNKNE